MSIELLRRKFTVGEYHVMGEAGVFANGDRLELLSGEIINMSPIGKRHAARVDRLNRLLSRIPEERTIVRVQNPILLDDRSEPQPDIALVKPRSDFYESSLPTPSDVLLLVEVADSTIDYDRNIKIPLYAKAGIVEVWLLDIEANCIEIYRQPTADGYQFVQTANRGEMISPLEFPEFEIDVNFILSSSKLKTET